MKHWLKALRLRTLPLALGAIIMGLGINISAIDWPIAIFTLLTAIGLQILSNLANDYGDYTKGADKHRKDRQVSQGRISPMQIKRAIGLCVLFSLTSGLILLQLAFAKNLTYYFSFLTLGIVSILAAIYYTMGKKAYGYRGLGDVFVFIFFGLVGVLGTAFLQIQTISYTHILPAIAYGLLATAVLNINNIRDIVEDKKNKKITLAVKLGKKNALIYHAVILFMAVAMLILYGFLSKTISPAPLVLVIIVFFHLQKLQIAKTIESYNVELKRISLAALITAILSIIQL